MVSLIFNELDKAKNDKDVCNLVKKIRIEIKKLLINNKKVDREYLNTSHTRETMLENYKYFLQKAKNKYFFLRKDIVQNKEENHVNLFLQNINTIENIVLERSSLTSPSHIIDIEINENDEGIKKYYISFGQVFDSSFFFELSKNEFIDKLISLHIERWRDDYNNLNALDGEQWEVTFYCKNEIFSFSGLNAYPHNFKKFLRLLGEY